MQTTDANPLALPVFMISPADLIPGHGADRPEDLAAITASMTENGWQGAALVIDDRNFRDDDETPGDGGYLLTGNHRQRAAIAAGLAEIPCVSVEDLAKAVGLDLDAYGNDTDREDFLDTDWERFFYDVPADVRRAYGLDL